MGSVELSPKVIFGVGTVIGILVIMALAHWFNVMKVDQAKTYPDRLVNYVTQKYEADGSDFALANYMDVNKTYVKIDNSDKDKVFYKENIKGTAIYYTGGTIDNGTTIDLGTTVPELKDGQVDILLITNSEDLSTCAGTGGDIALPASETANATNISSDKPDICRGYDTSIKYVGVVGTPNTIDTIDKDVFNQAAKYKVFNATINGNAYSGVLIPLK